MTKIEELEKTVERIAGVVEMLGDAKRGAVLSRKRRERIERLQTAAHDLVADIEEELERRRGVAA